jgi:hypothetical protein
MVEQTVLYAQPVEIVQHQQHRSLRHMVTTTSSWMQVPGTVNFMYVQNQLLYVRATLKDRHKTLDKAITINVEDVVGQSELVRSALNEFTKAHYRKYLDALPLKDMLERFRQFQLRASWDGALGLVDPDRLAAWTEIVASDEMQKLVTRGSDLFKALFGEGKVARLLRTLAPGTHLVMQTAGGTGWPTQVPWGLMYRGDPDATINPEDFLGLCFRLEHGIAQGERGLGDPAAATAGNVLFWGGGGEEDKPAETEAEQQRAVFSAWNVPKQVFYPHGPDPDPGKFARVISFLQKPEPSPVSVMYLYGHTESDSDKVPALRLGMDGEESQIVDDIKLGRKPLEGHPLVFVNACSSSNGSGRYRNRFAGVFRERGCNAYIGTEAAVPTVLASRVGILFFSLFYRQIIPVPMAAGEVMTQVRRFLWEEYRNIGGLFYSYVDQYDLYLADKKELDQQQFLQTAIVTLIEQPTG